MIRRTEYILRDQLAANPQVAQRFEFGKPAFVVFAENLSDEDAVLHIKGGQDIAGPFVRQYGADSLVNIPARASMIPAVITDIAAFTAFHLGARINDGVRIEVVAYQPVPSFDLATESLTVV